MERQRQRALNPAYEPRYTEQALRRAAEGWSNETMKQWLSIGGHNERPIRDIQVFRFLPQLAARDNTATFSAVARRGENTAALLI